MIQASDWLNLLIILTSDWFRILSRDECFDSNKKTANMSALFPCGDSMVCIIDDREVTLASEWLLFYRILTSDWLIMKMLSSY